MILSQSGRVRRGGRGRTAHRMALMQGSRGKKSPNQQKDTLHVGYKNASRPLQEEGLEGKNTRGRVILGREQRTYPKVIQSSERWNLGPGARPLELGSSRKERKNRAKIREEQAAVGRDNRRESYGPIKTRERIKRQIEDRSGGKRRGRGR